MTAHQTSLEELGDPLSEATFVVVDLETTGARADESGITEIGAVKVRGGEVLGEFGTLVNPDAPIPPFITVLTGITEAMVATAPRIDTVLPAFLEFARGAVLVAHNAPFDIGFLKAACAAHDHPWPKPTVLDTVPLARRLVTRDEVPNHKLATLAAFFRVADQPTHRALDDARATVGVLHALIERAGSFGVTTVQELRALRSSTPTATQRRKRALADNIPARPGVYVFEDARGDALYIGKSGNLRNRVRSYFTAGETRGRIREMVGLAERVTPIVCGTALEAEVRELRLIAERKPPYNRRSRNPERAAWLKLTDEVFPRLSIVRGTATREDAPYLGPFTSNREAELARGAIYQTFPLRQCTHRLSPRKPISPCVLAQLKRCGAPCSGQESVADYAVHAERVRAAMTADPSPVVAELSGVIADLAGQLRYEEAAMHRDRLAAFLRGADRAERLSRLAACPHLVAARRVPEPGGGNGSGGAGPRWELCVVRHGRLAASDTMPTDADPHAFLRALVATAETVSGGPGPTPAAGFAEMECVLRWLESPGVRLLELEGTWSCGVRGAGRFRHLTHWSRGEHPVE